MNNILCFIFLGAAPVLHVYIVVCTNVQTAQVLWLSFDIPVKESHHFLTQMSMKNVVCDTLANMTDSQPGAMEEDTA